MSESKNTSPGARRPGRAEALTVRDRAELTAHAGDYAAARTVEFIELCGNPHTQRAYARAISEFVRWCSARQVTLAEVQPFHVARYMRELGEPPAGAARKTGLAPLSRKQHRAALSMWLNSFRATAITLHQLNGGDLESARQLANHSSIKTTQLYNRAGDKKKRAEVERVQF